MRTIISGILFVFCLQSAASAQAISDNMTCEQAVAHYEQHNRIETIAEGQVIPIDEGVPVSKREELPCDEGELPGPVFVKTTDKRECAIAYTCPEE